MEFDLYPRQYAVYLGGTSFLYDRTAALGRRTTVIGEPIHVCGTDAIFLYCSRGTLRKHLLDFMRENNSKSRYNLFILSLFSLVIFFLILFRFF